MNNSINNANLDQQITLEIKANLPNIRSKNTTVFKTKEDKLKSFLTSPYGLMSSTKVEEKFIELDLLKNGMVASDTCKGAANLALFYSLYKTAQMHCVAFETYMKKAIAAMSEHQNEITFMYRITRIQL